MFNNNNNNYNKAEMLRVTAVILRMRAVTETESIWLTAVVTGNECLTQDTVPYTVPCSNRTAVTLTFQLWVTAALTENTLDLSYPGTTLC